MSPSSGLFVVWSGVIIVTFPAFPRRCSVLIIVACVNNCRLFADPRRCSVLIIVACVNNCRLFGPFLSPPPRRIVFDADFVDFLIEKPHTPKPTLHFALFPGPASISVLIIVACVNNCRLFVGIVFVLYYYTTILVQLPLFGRLKLPIRSL